MHCANVCLSMVVWGEFDTQIKVQLVNDMIKIFMNILASHEKFSEQSKIVVIVVVVVCGNNFIC
jgi:hypothetical protein